MIVPELTDGWFTILAIFVGWILGVISSGFRSRIEKKQALSKALARLIPAYFRLVVLFSSFESFKKGTKDWEQFEDIRVGALKRHGDIFGPNKSNELMPIVDEIAVHRPILAIKLRNLIHLIRKLLGIRTPLIRDANTELYIKILSIQEVGYEVQLQHFKSLIRHLAFGAGVLTYIKTEILLYQYRERSKEGADDSNLLDNLFEEMMDTVAQSEKADKR